MAKRDFIYTWSAAVWSALTLIILMYSRLWRGFDTWEHQVKPAEVRANLDMIRELNAHIAIFIPISFILFFWGAYLLFNILSKRQSKLCQMNKLLLGLAFTLLAIITPCWLWKSMERYPQLPEAWEIIRFGVIASLYIGLLTATLWLQLKRQSPIFPDS